MDIEDRLVVAREHGWAWQVAQENSFTVLYVDCSGGEMNLYMGSNYTEVHIHIQGERNSESKSEQAWKKVRKLRSVI